MQMAKPSFTLLMSICASMAMIGAAQHGECPGRRNSSEGVSFFAFRAALNQKKVGTVDDLVGSTANYQELAQQHATNGAHWSKILTAATINLKRAETHLRRLSDKENGDPTHHAKSAANYEKLHENWTNYTENNKTECRKCIDSETELIESLREAGAAHRSAEQWAYTVANATANNSAVVKLLADQKEMYRQAAEDMYKIKLTYKSSKLDHEDFVNRAQQLYPLALRILDSEADQQASETALSEAKVALDQVHEAAALADETVPEKQDEARKNCASFQPPAPSPSPADVVGHWDAMATASLVVAGDKAILWKDVSGHSLDLGSGNPPSFDATALKGKPGVKFGASHTYMVSTVVHPTYDNKNKPFTWIVVLQKDAHSATWSNFFTTNDGPKKVNGPYTWMPWSMSPGGVHWWAHATHSVHPVIPADQVTVVTHRWDGTTYDVWYGTKKMASWRIEVHRHKQGYVAMGHGMQNNGHKFIGSIGEALAFVKALDDEALKAEISRLNAKWLAN